MLHRFLLVLSIFLVHTPSPASAEDPARARQAYVQCLELFDAGKPCKALVVCQDGLAAAPLTALTDLAAKADKACEKKKKKAEKKKKTIQAPTCPNGQEITADTSGQCCWQGQVWNVDRCFGQPTSCPSGHDVLADGCALKTCLAEQVRPDDVHCCWPNQLWSTTRQICVGPPECPRPMLAEGELCLMDADNDGFEDEFVDICPDAAEDEDGFKDYDGCPDLDNDEDGIEDAQDACPNIAETLNGIEDADGCPEPDSDEDGVVDPIDACPQEVGKGKDGCPEIKTLPSAPPRSGAMAGAGWSFLGAGLLVAGVGTGVHFYAESERALVLEPDDVHPDTGVIQSVTELEAKRIEKDADTADAIAVSMIVLGSAALVSGAILLIVDAVSSGATDTHHVNLHIAPGAVLLEWTGRF